MQLENLSYPQFLLKYKFYVIESDIADLLKGFPGHEIDHIGIVMEHTYYSLQSHNFTLQKLDTQRMLEVMLASFLHEVDDSKIFPENSEYQNAKRLLRIYQKETGVTFSTENVIRMISLVSSSKNGDTVPPDLVNSPEFLYPRYSDRLEALGWIGVLRCLQYALYKGIPMFIETSPKPQTVDELWDKFATLERYKGYNGKSSSFIDHFYDKMFRLSRYTDYGVTNQYLVKMANSRVQPMIKIAMEYSRDGKFREDLYEFLEEMIKSERPNSF